MHFVPAKGDAEVAALRPALFCVQVDPRWQIVQDSEGRLRIRKAMRTKNFTKVDQSAVDTVYNVVVLSDALQLARTEHGPCTWYVATVSHGSEQMLSKRIVPLRLVGCITRQCLLAALSCCCVSRRLNCFNALGSWLRLKGTTQTCTWRCDNMHRCIGGTLTVPPPPPPHEINFNPANVLLQALQMVLCCFSGEGD